MAWLNPAELPEGDRIIPTTEDNYAQLKKHKEDGRFKWLISAPSTP